MTLRILLLTFVLGSTGACSVSSTNNARRSEGLEAAKLTQGPPLAVALKPLNAQADGPRELEVIWVDEARQRAIPARLFMPRDVSVATPLIIFSHGLGGSRLSYTQLGKHWATQGFISVHLQHAGSDRAIWTASGLAMLSSLKHAASIDNAIARARDVSFAIDQLQREDQLKTSIDFERIAVAGHSFGANTALLVAGAQFKFNGKWVAFGDPRVKAAVIMSPPSLPLDQDAIYTYNPIHIPTLHLTGTRDDTPIPGLSTMAAQRSEAFDAMVATPRYLAVYEGGRHSMFHDRTTDKTSMDIKANAKEASTLFLRAALLGDRLAEGQLNVVLKPGPVVARSDMKLAAGEPSLRQTAKAR
jgi:dienelactone hydrolase